MALIIVGADPRRVQEEYEAERKRRIARGETMAGVTTSVRPIVQPGQTAPPAQITTTPQQFQLDMGRGQVITGDTLRPSADFADQLTTPQYNIPFDISKFGEGLFQKTAPEAQAQEMGERIKALHLQFAGKPAFEAERAREFGVPEKETAIRDLEAQITTLRNEALAIPIKLKEEAEGRGITTTILGRQEKALLRQNAIKALTLNSLHETMMGNLLNAQSMVDRAVAEKYDAIEAERNALISNYNIIINSPDYTLAQRRRAEILKTIETDRKETDKEDREAMKSNLKLANDAIKKGLTDTVILSQIQDAVDEFGRPSIAKAQEIYMGAGLADDVVGDFTPQEERKLEQAGIDWRTPEGRSQALDFLYAPKDKATPQDKALAWDEIKKESVKLFSDGITIDEYNQMRKRLIDFNMETYLDDLDKIASKYFTPEQKREVGIELEKEEIEEFERGRGEFLTEDYLSENYTDEELWQFAKKTGQTSFWTGKIKDIARWKKWAIDRIKTAREQGFSDDEILEFITK